MANLDCQSKLTDSPLEKAYCALKEVRYGIVNLSEKKAQDLAARLQAISDAAKDGLTWHAITDILSEAEVAGVISTQLTQTWHHLCLHTLHHHYLIPQTLVSSLRLPDPGVYQTQLQRYVAGQRLSLQEIVKHLAKTGYTRSRRQLDKSQFRVRGEAIDIWHPVWAGPVTITLHGPSIEKITKDRLLLPPVAFPNQTMALSEAVRQPEAAIISLPPFLFPRQAAASLASPISQQRALELIGALELGKPAVHTDHGIGLYEGLQTKIISDLTHEYLVLQYAAGDLLYVPVEFAHKVSAFLGDRTPTIHRLGGSLWAKTKRRAQAEAADVAHELLTVAGARERARRPAYQIDPQLEQELTRSFLFTLTPDQARTWQEVQGDLTSPRPLDRLIVGDVGFGKTEIALRAAAHVMANKKQVAVLAPTTLLVQQHADIFEERLKTKIDVFSRLTPRRFSKVGPIAVGTHALLSPKTKWQNLGLVIIDEEQKFGVRQKEHFKKLRAAVDVLSLSATPIPRTLAMTLSGLRDLSLIQTPPPKRRSVQTHVTVRRDELLQTAIKKELARGGQVYLVASKIKHLAAIHQHLAALVPSACLGLAHGRLPVKVLADTIHQFDTGKIDILISSNIVENGLDLPNVNTMIVWDSTNFGLADLYQLRGRIGRRARQGFAYFFYNQHELSGSQRQRLTALIEASRLGAGWSLARRDLEIRGAGNLLGKAQSGTANEVGMQLYLDLVNQAVQEHAGKIEKPRDTEISLPLPALLPTSYIANTAARARTYQRLARAATLADLAAHQADLEQSFGPLPEPARNLMLIIRLQHAAAARNINKIDSQKITPPGQVPFFRVTLHGKPRTTLETPTVTAAFVQNLIKTLQLKHA